MPPGDQHPTFSFDEAAAAARQEAKRILQLDRQAVRYIKYDPYFFHDFCVVSIVFDESGRGTMTLTMLPLAERHGDEHFTDEHIRNVAKAGKILDAIRLYRLLHSADLVTAKKAVERMLIPH